MERELPFLPWFHAFQYFSSSSASELDQEKDKWKKLSMDFPSYAHMVKSVYLDATEHSGNEEFSYCDIFQS